MTRSDIIAVVGGMWGDEGKSKILGGLVRDAALVIRGNGGANAGHTQYTDKGDKFVFHLIPSGILNPKTINLIGPGVFINLTRLLTEMEELEERGIGLSNLRISPKAHLTFEYHLAIEELEEKKRGQKKIGTTGQGIGPTASDKVRRIGLRAGLLQSTRGLLDALSQTLAFKIAEYPEFKNDERFEPGYYETLVRKASKRLSSYIIEARDVIKPVLDKNGKIILEGAQATLLGIDHGTYPRVTSTEPSFAGLALGSEINPRIVTQVIGVFKAYASRVGEGGFPTELKNAQGELIRQRGNEYGATTGRPRRVGYFDLVAARYSHWINQYTDIAITRLDTLADTGGVQVCPAYELGERVIKDMPSDDQVLLKCRPKFGSRKYQWSESGVKSAKTFNELPKGARDYCVKIMEAFPGAKLSYIGTGPRNSDLIYLK